MQSVVKCCLMALLLLTASWPIQAAGPNIIFILVDDLGWRELGCEGNTFNETPHLDRIAREGVRFTQAYASAPVCSPTRAALMTGLWPARLGINDYLGPHEKEKYLRPEQPTLNKHLKTRGYVTGLIGKWHLTGDYSLKRGEPAKHGWDEVICSETSYIGPGYLFPPYQHIPELKPVAGEEYLTDRLNHEAVRFIERNREKPFFLYLSHYAVHTKLVAKPELVAKYEAKEGAGKPGPNSPTRNINNPILAAMLQSVDEGAGEIVRTIERLKLADNTLIIFTSDNGGESVTGKGIGVTSVAPLRGGKSHLYEGGIRVSLLARWPGVIKAGGVSAEAVSSIDLFATMLDAGGVELGTIAHDGRSLLPVMRGESGALPARALYWHYPLAKPHFLGGRSSGAMREGDWKLIEFFDSGDAELYDLRNDIAEQHNLAAQQPRRLAEMKQKLSEWRQNVNASTTP